MENANFNNVLSQLAVTPASGSLTGEGERKSWFQAFAEAWGKSLDRQSGRLIERSESIGVDEDDTPSQIALLTAEAQKMAYLSTASQSSTTAVGEALRTMARRQ